MPVEGFFADYDWFGPFGMMIITIIARSDFRSYGN